MMFEDDLRNMMAGKTRASASRLTTAISPKGDETPLIWLSNQFRDIGVVTSRRVLVISAGYLKCKIKWAMNREDVLAVRWETAPTVTGSLFTTEIVFEGAPKDRYFTIDTYPPDETTRIVAERIAASTVGRLQAWVHQPLGSVNPSALGNEVTEISPLAHQEHLPQTSAEAEQELDNLNIFDDDGLRRGLVLEHCLANGLSPYSNTREATYASALQMYGMNNDDESVERVVRLALVEFTELPFNASGAWIAVHAARMASTSDDEVLARRVVHEVNRMQPYVTADLALKNVADEQNFPDAAHRLTDRWGHLSV